MPGCHAAAVQRITAAAFIEGAGLAGALISYGRDPPDHDARVLALAERLITYGVERPIKRYKDAPNQATTRTSVRP